MKSIKKIGSRQRLYTFCLLLMSFFLLAATTVFSAGEVPASATAEQDAEPRAILSEMADVLSQAPGYSVTVLSSYDAIQEDGQYIEFGERRNILLQRPERLRVDVERSDGEQDLLVFDGQTMTAYKSGDNVYAQVEKPGSVDNAIVYLVKDLQISFPLARMFLTTFSRDVQQWIESVRFVEENLLTDPPSVHLAGQGADVDFQIWVAEGERLLPQRIVLTYRNEPGQPQFRADFIDWALEPEIDPARYTFLPPDGAEQILFLAPVQESPPPVEQEGGKP